VTGRSSASGRGRQGRLLAGLADRQLWSGLQAESERFAAAEDRYVAHQREVVAQQRGFPISAAIIVIAALSVTVMAATVIGVIVYRRKSTGNAPEETAASTDGGLICNGRSLHEQLGRQSNTQQPTFRWNF